MTTKERDDASTELAHKAIEAGVPVTTAFTIANYVIHKIQTGGFLFAVLSNDLSESFARADMGNRAAMFEIVSFIYNSIPSKCWGSKEKVQAWLEV